jgi:V8-like Glu-specific endopeptidase
MRLSTVKSYPQRKVQILYKFKFRGKIAFLNQQLAALNPTKRTAFSYQVDGIAGASGVPNGMDI